MAASRMEDGTARLPSRSWHILAEMSARRVVACLPFLLAACASAPPAAPPSAPVAAIAKEPPIDVSPVPEPAGLILLGRVRRPDAIVKAVGDWTKLPLPSGSELLRSVADDSIAETVDLSQPVDAAMTAGFSVGGFEPIYAYSVAVKSYDAAKIALGKAHRLVPGENGQIKVLDMGHRGPSGNKGHRKPKSEEEDDDSSGTSCILAHAPTGARLVCGEGNAAEALAPYLARTMTNAKWSSDIHLELHTEPLRLPLTQLPALVRGLTGGGRMPSMREIVDASIGELADVVNDTQKFQIDAQVADTGVVTTTRLDFQTNKSAVARMVTKSTATEPPAAFWHLPGDADAAAYTNGSDPKLFDHPRELLGNLLVEAATPSGLPDAERKALKDVVVDRMLQLFTTGGSVYGKGYDAAALDKALAARAKVKPNDVAGDAEAKRLVVEQAVGWHLYQVGDPIAKVGPLLKDWSALWNRPAFAKWAKGMKDTVGDLPRMQNAALPAGVALPKDTVHLEVTIPRDDIEDMSGPAVQTTKKPATPVKPKMIHRKPVVFHILAVPDGGATWLAFGLDAKLVATKAAASLATAPDATSLGHAPRREALHEGKWNAAGFATVRGLVALGAGEGAGDPLYLLLPSLPSKGDAPIFGTAVAEPASPTAPAGASVTTFTIGRAAIEEIVKLAISSK